MNRAAELIIVPPRSEPGVVDDFVAKCVIHGVHFLAEPGDRLPDVLPFGVSGVRAILIEYDQVAENAAALAEYEKRGVCVYRMNRHLSPSVPNTTLTWGGALTFQAISFDALLTHSNPAAMAAMLVRDDEPLIDTLGERLLTSENARWYDATRYQWESMLGIYEFSRDRRFLDTAERQIHHAIENVPNDLSNCDTVAPIIPVLQLHQVTRDAALLTYATQTLDRYLDVAPRYHGCLLNFAAYPRSVRSEILWQVLPGLMLASRITGDPRYATVATEQYERLHALLFDSNENLWCHGNRDGRRSAAFWARGVAFGFVADVCLLELMDPTSTVYDLCRHTLQRGAARLRELQDPSGFWFAVVDNPTAGRESSSAAWLCAGFERAIHLGILGDEYRPVAESAWRAVKSRIWNGDYPGHMAGTTVSLQPEYYLRKPLVEKGWAHFPLRAIIERRRTMMAQTCRTKAEP